MLYKTDDVRINKIKDLLPPIALLERFPLSEKASKTVYSGRQAIHNILNHKDDRLFVVIGPCSIHDPKAALEYGDRLSKLRQQYKSNLEIVMRVYFEKPRTTVGWKGLINDPYMNGSFELNDGLRIGRKLLLDLNELGLPTAGEYLDMITPQYMADFMCWGAIGARTTESQVHRELASGLSCPVGFKNGTDGTIKIAIDAIGSAAAPHHFLSVTKFGHAAIVETTGNKDCHIILRGGKTTNFDQDSVSNVTKQLKSSSLNTKIMIDFSHANSCKKFKNQMLVCEDVSKQIRQGNENIFGVMVESHLVEGRQDLINGEAITYGQSITDACIGFEDTEILIKELNDAVAMRKAKNKI
ncbi:3-deoxy-7-phosphoheptulonate synthase [Parashewanella spongiae]|uniref:Phospho-2-dehydro-3-deoxyheptonate aldolase n=1 Tax=Parashewanella spongiae TaxID=342950 RepID=A0A3A6UKH9_9GAMM|nr:3-deoxy-7-phosphoheptulonate synthase AroG [Parashewanella spongiae]MCL1077725.1 3-deoxy-7-phosphoheptulonate synthase AroG [Parashewanella spongiae]RJY18073.1 3-deoxy-7-phosphoheptulonate synthase [Parashewanella spongiae]